MSIPPVKNLRTVARSCETGDDTIEDNFHGLECELVNQITGNDSG